MISLHNNHTLNTFLVDAIEVHIILPESTQQELNELRNTSLETSSDVIWYTKQLMKQKLCQYEIDNSVRYRKIND